LDAVGQPDLLTRANDVEVLDRGERRQLGEPVRVTEETLSDTGQSVPRSHDVDLRQLRQLDRRSLARVRVEPCGCGWRSGCRSRTGSHRWGAGEQDGRDQSRRQPLRPSEPGDPQCRTSTQGSS
jgi:hypothetical protein